MAASRSGRFSNSDIARLAEAIDSSTMELIASDYMDFEIETIINVKDAHGGNTGAINREIISFWMAQNSDTGQKQVSLLPNISTKIWC